MVQQITPETARDIIYPDSDGQPMADNTKQFTWIVTIKENLEILFATQSDVFVAGNLLWYPVEGEPKIRQAPDAMVAFSRPKGDRGSYLQWKEGNVIPQVVFEILSPGNNTREMAKKLLFYQRYGVEEYYIYDPDSNELTGLIRSENWLQEIENINGWESPLLKIRFQPTPTTLEIYRPDGQKFLTPVELDQLRQQEAQRADQEAQRADQEAQRADQEAQLRQQEKQQKEAALQQLELQQQRYQELLLRLQERGINPEEI